MLTLDLGNSISLIEEFIVGMMMVHVTTVDY